MQSVEFWTHKLSWVVGTPLWCQKPPAGWRNFICGDQWSVLFSEGSYSTVTVLLQCCNSSVQDTWGMEILTLENVLFICEIFQNRTCIYLTHIFLHRIISREGLFCYQIIREKSNKNTFYLYNIHRLPTVVRKMSRFNRPIHDWHQGWPEVSQYYTLASSQTEN